jgi:hypothetical protein
MTPERIDYIAILNDMKAKRAVLEASIAALEAALASGTLGQGVEGLGSSGSAGSVPTSQGMPMDLPKGAFLGKNMTDSVLLYLSAVRQRKTVKDIAAALLEGGIVSTSDNFAGVVQAKMQQLNGRGQVLKFADGWGLAEWYPAGFRASADKAAKPKKKANAKSKQKPAGRKATAPTQATPISETSGESLDSRIEQILSADKSKTYTTPELIETLEAPSGAAGSINFALGRLVRKHKAEKTPEGHRAFSGNIQQMPLAG